MYACLYNRIKKILIFNFLIKKKLYARKKIKIKQFIKIKINNNNSD